MCVDNPSKMTKQEIENNLIMAKNIFMSRPKDENIKKTIQFLINLKVQEKVKESIFQGDDPRLQYCCPKCGSDSYKDGVCGYCIP